MNMHKQAKQENLQFCVHILSYRQTLLLVSYAQVFLHVS